MTAMVNAAAGADAHGGRFGFVWPRVREAHLEDPSDLFTDDFLVEHELTDDDLADGTAIWFAELVPLSDAELRTRLTAQPEAFVEVGEVFSIVRWMHEEPAAARLRYRSCFDRFGWNETARAIIDASDDWLRGGPRGAVHVRAGDIIDGDWNLFLAHAKYSPTPLVHEAIRQQSDRGNVLVVSDNPAYLDWLVDRFPSVVTAREIVPGYEHMPDVHRAFADLVLLSRCATVVAPPSSAFSGFASLVGGTQIVRSNELCEQEDLRDLMARGVVSAIREAKSSPMWSKLAPRDIAWHLDVFGDELAPKDRWKLAKTAVDLDPTFVGGLNRFARAGVERRRWAEAARAADRAIALSQVAAHRDDPLFESLVTRLLVACLDAIGHRRQVDTALADEIFAHADELTPHMTKKPLVLQLLRALVAASSVRGRRTALDDPGGPSTLANHIAARHYDPLTPDVERLARQVGVAV